MSFVDRAINAATDAARSSAANYQRAQRRRAIQQQMAAHQQAIQWSMGRIGQLTVEQAHPTPAAAEPATNAIRHWMNEVAALSQQLAAVDAQLAPPAATHHPSSGYGAAPPPAAP
jgi:chromosome segregation ATPase